MRSTLLSGLSFKVSGSMNAWNRGLANPNACSTCAGVRALWVLCLEPRPKLQASSKPHLVQHHSDGVIKGGQCCAGANVDVGHDGPVRGQVLQRTTSSLPGVLPRQLAGPPARAPYWPTLTSAHGMAHAAAPPLHAASRALVR